MFWIHSCLVFAFAVLIHFNQCRDVKLFYLPIVFNYDIYCDLNFRIPNEADVLFRLFSVIKLNC